MSNQETENSTQRKSKAKGGSRRRFMIGLLTGVFVGGLLASGVSAYSHSDSGWWARSGHGHHGMRDPQAAIERMQPYKRGHWGKRNLLWHLQQMNNLDKHSLLLVLGVKPSIVLIGYRQEASCSILPRFPMLKDGAKVLEAGAGPEEFVGLLPLIGSRQGRRFGSNPCPWEGS